MLFPANDVSLSKTKEILSVDITFWIASRHIVKIWTITSQGISLVNDINSSETQRRKKLKGNLQILEPLYVKINKPSQNTINFEYSSHILKCI